MIAWIVHAVRLIGAMPYWLHRWWEDRAMARRPPTARDLRTRELYRMTPTVMDEEMKRLF